MDSSRAPKPKMNARNAHEHEQQRNQQQHPQHGGGMDEYEHHRHAHHPPPPHHMHDFTVMMGEYPPPPPPPPPPPHSMMGGYPDPYGMHGPYIPMHPSEAGNEPHNMMDFPPPPPPARFLPPRRMQQRPPRLPNRIIVESSMQHAARGPKSPGDAFHGGMDNEPATKRKERAPSSSSFPTKLYKILADPQYREYITWLPHGRAWRVLKPKAFEEDVIPKFFRSERYASFMRQVNGWGFRRITEGPDLNAYYHEMFLRGLPQICAGMRRPQKGKTPITPAKDLGQAPDFYKISMFAPLPQVDDDRKRTPRSPGRASTQQDPKSATEQRGPGEAPDTPKGATASLSKVTPDREGQRESNESDKKAQAEHSSPKPTETVSSSMMPSASPLSASPNPHSDQFGPALSPSDIGGSFVDVPNSAGNSISSWNDQPDHDILWGSSILNSGNGYSPQASPGGFHFPTSSRGGFPHHPPQTPSAFGQVTPPENGRPLIPPRGRAGDMMRSVPPMPPPLPNGVDGSGLSPADLSYLTHQNRILLDQARTGNENKKKKH